MSARVPLPLASGRRNSAHYTSKGRRNPKPLNRLVRIYLLSSSAITSPPAISAPPSAGFSQLSRRVTSSPRPTRPSPISVRPSTNPSNSPGTNPPTSSVELTGAERSPRASNHRHLIPSPFPNQPHPSNRHLLQPRPRPPTQTLPTLLSNVRKVFLQERARPSRPLYL